MEVVGVGDGRWVGGEIFILGVLSLEAVYFKLF